MLRLNRVLALIAVLSLSLVPTKSEATLIHTWTGTLPSTSVEVSVQAEFTISGDLLTVVLSNNSTGLVPASSTLNPADLLTSLYFDIENDGDRPTLTYEGATGDVYLGAQNTADTLVDAGADLIALDPDDGTWQFKSGLALPVGGDVLTFGIGTAGNSDLHPNGFNGNIVGGFDYGIYAGDISTHNLDGTLLVSQTATYLFKGLSGFTEADIAELVVFGFGTQPELTVTAPEPGTFAMVGLGLLAMNWVGRRRSQ